MAESRQSLIEDQHTALEEMATALTKSNEEKEELTNKLRRERRRRRDLHNLVMELRGNIRVLCRVRPLLARDGGGGGGGGGGPGGLVVRVRDEENVDVQTGPRGVKTFPFERAFAPMESQEDVFDEVAPMLTSLLDGYNAAILAYGQTGSGKTHTMVGGAGGGGGMSDEGIIPKAAKYIFDAIEERQKEDLAFDGWGGGGGKREGRNNKESKEV